MDLDYFLDQYYQATHIPVSFFQDRALVSKSSLSAGFQSSSDSAQRPV